MHVIAAKAVAFGEALKPEFREYAENIVKNAKAFAEGLKAEGFRLVSGGTDNHLILVDVRNKILTGKEAEKLLDNIGITCNKNTIPFDPASPFVTSGIRLGTPAATTRGFKEEDFKEVAAIMGLVLNNPEDTDKHAEAAKRVAALCAKYPLYTNLKLRRPIKLYPLRLNKKRSDISNANQCSKPSFAASKNDYPA